ncbi:MAG: hypothetical protein ACHQEM_04500 [Chitinophagales bacterium]
MDALALHFHEHARIRLRLFILICLSFCIGSMSLGAVRTWTGNAGDGQWSNPLNWDAGQLPFSTDDVLLDNSFVGTNYTVSLPNTMVIIRTLNIVPASNQTIQLILPATNLSEPGFTVTGPGYGINLERGAIFLNASGLTSGEALMISDSIRINNGARYIHHTRASHANNIVRLISTSPGTELGIFEFDVPRSSYTISASNRTYGSLVLRAVASGGATTYACNGSNPLTINGNLQIEEGVNFSVDLGGANGNVLIKRDYIQNGGIFNLASGAGNSTIVRISGNLIQSPGAQITETNTGLPAIELNGTAPQIISLSGTIINSINMRMNNPEGAILLAPLQLPYRLELLRGKITSTTANLLTLLGNCAIVADSTVSNTSYVEGPLRKLGLLSNSHFLFPVGKNGQRWLELKNVSGDFMVEYFRANPRAFSQTYGPGIDHVSAQEYWTVNSSSGPISNGNVELSFLDPGSGGVTEISTLRVAELNGSVWKDDGQTFSSGIPGSQGSVLSNAINPFSEQSYFTLASSVNLDNPLPVKLLGFSVRSENHFARLHWTIAIPEDADNFDILSGNSESSLTAIKTIEAAQSQKDYECFLPFVSDGVSYFRLAIHEKSGISFSSKIISIRESPNSVMASINPSIVYSTALVKMHAEEPGVFQWQILGMEGKIYKSGSDFMEVGEHTLSLDLALLPSGIYAIVVYKLGKRVFLLRFIKRK